MSQHLIPSIAQSKCVPHQVLRDGAPLTLDVQLMKPTPLVPMHLAGRDPTFFVVAGASLLSAPVPHVVWPGLKDHSLGSWPRRLCGLMCRPCKYRDAGLLLSS